MALQDVKTYNYEDTFSLSIVQFDKACVVNNTEQIDAYSIYWIKQGEGTYNIDFKNYTFSDNVMFFLSPGQVFSVDNESIKEAYKLTFIRDFYCIATHDKEVSCNGVLFNNIYEIPFIKPCKSDTKKLDFIIENLIEEFKVDDTGHYDMLQTYLKQFVIQSVRIKKENFPIKDTVETKLFKDYSLLVDQNFKTLHSVTDYANRLGVSPKSLAKHFQKVSAETPSDYIKKRLILEAKRQLIYTDNSVKQIAYDLGFNDSAYFSRFFTKAEQKSPLQFKKDHKD